MRTIARLLIVAVLAGVFAAASLAFDCDLGRNVAGVEVGPAWEGEFEADVVSGDCWTSGEGHGYPTRMWTLEVDAYGSVYVEVVAQERIDHVIETSDYAAVAAFCDGIDLS